MSVIANFQIISTEDLQKIISNDLLIYQAVFPEEWQEIMTSELKRRKSKFIYKLSKLKNLFNKKTRKAIPSSRIIKLKAKALDIDKARPGIHFALTGEKEKFSTNDYHCLFCLALYGEKGIGPEIGYGPAIYLEEEMVKKISEEFKKVSEIEFVTRAKKNLQTNLQINIYPLGTNWDNQAIDYLKSYFKSIKKYYLKAAKSEYAMLVWTD